MKRSIYWIFIIALLISFLPAPARATDTEVIQSTSPHTTESAETDESNPEAETASPPSETPELPTNDSAVAEISQSPSTEQNINEPAQASPANSSLHEGVVISQVLTRGSSGNASDELIELFNNSDDEIDVTDWCLKRASSTGASYIKLVCLGGETGARESRVLLPARSYVLAVSSSSSLPGSDVQFASGLSDAGGRVGLFNQLDERQDLVAWGATTSEFETAPVAILPPSGSLLQRKSLSAGVYQDTDNNQADFEIALPRSVYGYGALRDDIDMCLNLVGLQATTPTGWSRDTISGNCTDVPVNMCGGLVISEIGANRSSQFIELFNSSEYPLNITGCRLQTNRSSAQHILPDQIIAAHNYIVITIADTDLSLTKTTTGIVYLLSSDGAAELQTVSYADLDEETSWAWYGGSDWRQTYVVTPGNINQYQQYASCEVGYERNHESGRCNKIGVATNLMPCKEGQYRSEETNRCRSIASVAASVLKPCGDDQFRNPLTNRCKKIASADDLADCGEGRERNPETNRCRNVVQSDVPAAAFAVKPIKDSASAFAGWWALGGVGTLALGYAGWEWRKELRNLIQKATAFLSPKS